MCYYNDVERSQGVEVLSCTFIYAVTLISKCYLSTVLKCYITCNLFFICYLHLLFIFVIYICYLHLLFTFVIYICYLHLLFTFVHKLLVAIYTRNNNHFVKPLVSLWTMHLLSITGVSSPQ